VVTLPPIPAVWRIDVEPDEHQPRQSPKGWAGFAAMAEAVDRLRPRLEERAGAPVHPTWFFRLDPDIGRCFGRTDFVLDRHGDVVERLQRAGDPVGIHVHAHRWDAERQVVYSDYADPTWPTHCLEVCADAFARRFGEPVRRASQGGYLLTEALVDDCVRLGIEVDVTVEPGLPPKTHDSSFGVSASAPSTDFRAYPRRPYYPSRRAAGEPAATACCARPMLVVPLNAYDFTTGLASWPRRLIKRLRGRPRRHLPLNPWRSWPSPRAYWDLVARAVAEQPVPYVALAIRTDAAESVTHRRAQALMDALPDHPLATRLRFVDPLAPELRDLALGPAFWRGAPPLPAPSAPAPPS